MLPEVTFCAYGLPKPQGSKKHVGHGVMVEAAGAPLKTWREDMKAAALQAAQKLPGPLEGPVKVHASFFLPRPKGHWGTGRNSQQLRRGAPSYPAVKPDLDKLLRGLLDAITTAGLWVDDSQAVALSSSKAYATRGMPPGVVVSLAFMESPQASAPDSDPKTGPKTAPETGGR